MYNEDRQRLTHWGYCSSLYTQFLYDSLDEGREGVQNGDIWMVVYIPSNFSQWLVKNISTGFNTFSATLDPPNDTLIELYADLTGEWICDNSIYLMQSK